MARRKGKGKKRRNREKGGGGGGGGGGNQRPSQSLVIIAPAAPAAARQPQRKGGFSMARSVRKGARRAALGFRVAGRGIAQASYAAVSGDIGIQIGCEVAEGMGALLKGALDMVADSTETTADDTAFPILEKAIGSGARVLADMRLSRKHPGFAKVMSAFGSSLSGTVYLDWLRKYGAKAALRNAERLQK